MSLSGLDYLALEMVMRTRGVTSVRETFDDVQVLEAEALRVMQVRREQEDRRIKAKAKQT